MSALVAAWLGALAPHEPLHTNEGQSLRLVRHLLGALAALTIVVVVYGSALFGLMAVSVAKTFAALVFCSVLTFTVCIYSGFNRRFADPSLTVGQMAASGAAMAYLAYAAEEFRALQLPFYLVALAFGAFRLTTRQQLAISAYFVGTYGVAIGLGGGYALAGEGVGKGLLQVIYLALVLALMSLIGGYVHSMRVKLRARNNELKRALEEIKRIATYDELTGLYNRRVILELVGKEMKRCDRRGSSMCVALLDADHFKRFNDRYGHSTGDEVLRMLGRTLSQSLRETEYIGRYGGEEFVIVLPETPSNRAEIPLERLRDTVRSTVLEGLPDDVRVTVSIGVAEYRHGEDVSETVKRADAALYEAKRLGRDRIAWSRA
jgi:diguanylate cyclase (GGDEF)-like protein